MRFAWNFEQYIEKENLRPIMRSALHLYVTRLKKWDVSRNKGINHFVAISKAIQERIRGCYGLGSDMIYPPVNTSVFVPSQKRGDYFLVVSRLNAYKQIDLVIEACNALKMPLKIIGDGPHRSTLEKIAGPTVEFLGRVPEEVLIRHYAECRAFIFPGLEDFGIVPLEAQSAGRPVIAFAAGGALETIVDGVTGIFFKEQTSQELIKAIERFGTAESGFNATTIRKNALRFDKEIFKDNIAKYVMEKYEVHNSR
jgi:glycosyltransferase involved in cell wall biosynthesis